MDSYWNETFDATFCPTCGGTRIITALDPSDSPWFPKRVHTYRCPDCTDEATP
jgi:predicted RNA-binding Zn-ribbon protein involved in translation (DUF1610 family)